MAKGKVVLKLENDISTDIIYPGRFMATVLPSETPQFAFADDKVFNQALKDQKVPAGSFIVAGSRVRLPDSVQRALRYAPAAALAALVLPDMLLVAGELQPFNAKAFAGVAVFALAFRWKNPWLPFIVGMGLLWGLRAGGLS